MDNAPAQTTMEETAAGLGGASGGTGGGGVGLSTGGLRSTIEWKHLGGGEILITCHSSRLIHLNMPESEEYKMLTINNNARPPGIEYIDWLAYNNNHRQMLTPWALLDCNAWGVWMNPGEFQHMSTICEDINLDSLEQNIHSLSIKTVTEIGQGAEKTKQYNNDLIASMGVAVDSNNILPYTPAAGRDETLGFYPWRATNLKQWRYYLDNYNFDEWYFEDQTKSSPE